MPASLLSPLLLKVSPLYQVYAKKGFELRLVGGCVRDALLGKIAQDIDLATPALPSQGMEILQQAGIACIPTGLKHGTFTAILHHHPFEITTLRQDIQTDGRWAEVAFTDNWKIDASRRDLTINALYADFKGNLYDYFDGVSDLKAGRIRFIGDVAMRIQEDYLRLLRLFRFHAWYGKCPLDRGTLEICQRFADHLFLLSRERLTKELLRLLEAPFPLSTLEQMVAFQILPTLFTVPFLEQMGRLIAAEKRLSILPSSLRRLTILPQDLSLLRLSKHQESYLHLQSQLRHKDLINSVERYYLLSLYEKDFICDALLIKHSQNASFPFEMLKKLIGEVKTLTIPPFPLKGIHLHHLGISPGRQFSILLNQCRWWWAENQYNKSEQECVAWVHQHSKDLLNHKK